MPIYFSVHFISFFLTKKTIFETWCYSWIRCTVLPAFRMLCVHIFLELKLIWWSACYCYGHWTRLRNGKGGVYGEQKLLCRTLYTVSLCPQASTNWKYFWFCSNDVHIIINLTITDWNDIHTTIFFTNFIIFFLTKYLY